MAIVANIGGKIEHLKLGDPEELKHSPGWSLTKGTLGSSIGVHLFSHPTGVRYWDVFHVDAGNTLPISVTVLSTEPYDKEDSHEVFEDGKSLQFKVYPEAGRAFSFGTDAFEAYKGDKPFGPVGEPDYAYTGFAGSPRNGQYSRFYRAMKKPGGKLDQSQFINTLRYLEFQRRRPYQMGLVDGSFDTEKPTKAKDIEVVSDFQMWRYDVEHFSINEEAGIYELTRDPRAFDLVNRLMKTVILHDWYNMNGGSKNKFNGNSRAKGWWLAALARWAHMLKQGGSKDDRTLCKEAIVWSLDEISSKWAGRLPSRNAPDARHGGSFEWDNAWQIAILAHGLALLKSVGFIVDPLLQSIGFIIDPLLHRVLDVLEEFYDPDTNILYQDVDTDMSSKMVWTRFTDLRGTATWIPDPFFRAGRGDAPIVQAILKAQDPKKPIVPSWDEDYL